AGELTFSVEAAGSTPFWINRIERGGAPINRAIEIRRGEQIENLRIVVDYANGSIRGQVKILGGELPPNWQLNVAAERVAPSASFEGLPPFSRGGISGQIDEKGRFRIEPLVPGEYEVLVSASIMSNLGGRGAGVEPPIQRVTVIGGQETTVTITFDPNRGRQD